MEMLSQYIDTGLIDITLFSGGSNLKPNPCYHSISRTLISAGRPPYFSQMCKRACNAHHPVDSAPRLQKKMAKRLKPLVGIELTEYER
jgi:hypothetical protein